MRKAILMAMVALLVLALAVPVAGAVEHVELEWLQATCAIEWVEPTFTKGSMHVRGEVHHDVIYMGEAAVGTNTIVFEYDLSVATFNGRGGGDFQVELFGLPAPAFVGHFNGHIGPDGLRARAVGEGNGFFEGDRMTARIQQIPPEDWMCDGGNVEKAVAVTARIIDK